jgi:hypothetical protein
MVAEADSIYARTARQAAEILCGVYGLSAYFSVSVAEARGWLTGERAVPRPTFLRMVDVITDDLSRSERHAAAAARHVGRTTPDELDAPSGNSGNVFRGKPDEAG